MLRIVCLTLLVAVVSSQRLRAVSAPLGVSNYVTGGLAFAPVSTGNTFEHEEREWSKPDTAISREGIPAGINFDGSCDWSDQWANTWMKGWGNLDNLNGDLSKVLVDQGTAVPNTNTNDEVVVNEAPVQRVQYAPVQRVVSTPVRQVIVRPVQKVFAAPVQRIVAAPKYLQYRKVRTYVPLQRRIQYAPLQQVVQAPVQQVVTPVRRVIQTPVRRVIQTPVRQVIQTPVRQVFQSPVQQVITRPVRQVFGAQVQRVIATPSQQLISTPVRQLVTVPQSGQLVPVSQRLVVERPNVQQLVTDRSLNHFNFAPETLVLGTPTYTTARQQRVLTELPNHTLLTQKPSKVVSIEPKPLLNAPKLKVTTQNAVVQKAQAPIVQKVETPVVQKPTKL